MAGAQAWDPARPGAAAIGESVWSEELAAAICARVAAGEPLRKVCAEPGQPHRTTVRNWANARPEFAESLRAAYRHQRIGSRMRARQAAVERAARPSPLKGGKASSYTPALGEAICARLAEGESLTSISRDPAMPCYGTVFAWLHRHPDFEAMYVAAREIQAEYLFDEARDVAKAAERETVPVARLQFDVIRWQAARLAPKKYLERLVAAEARSAQPAAEPTRVVFSMMHFEKGPKGGCCARRRGTPGRRRRGWRRTGRRTWRGWGRTGRSGRRCWRGGRGVVKGGLGERSAPLRVRRGRRSGLCERTITEPACGASADPTSRTRAGPYDAGGTAGRSDPSERLCWPGGRRSGRPGPWRPPCPRRAFCCRERRFGGRRETHRAAPASR